MYQLNSMKRRRSSSSDERPRKPPKSKSIFDHLCSDCNKINWSSLAQNPKNNQPVVLITKSHEELRSSTCEACQLLDFLKSSDLDNSSCALKTIGLHKLTKTPTNASQPDTSILYIVPENSKPPLEERKLGHAIAVEPSPQAPSFLETQHLEHRNFNVGLITKWINECVDKHPECKQGTRSSTHTLEVIDCKKTKEKNPEKPELADLPTDGEYAALSYVWGDVDDKFPQVVRDSITVALQLGCKYLWVDRHCIHQKDKDPKKQELLGMMGDIYSQAKFTIVAAAGLDCNHGLVGVTRSRKPELRYTNVPGAKLTYLGTPPAEKIRSTLWASRGWTYQEGFLSHRRIFFTDEQVMFQCNAMICLESFENHMSVLHQPNKPKGRRNHFLLDIEPVNLAHKDIGKHLEEFSNRNLTKDSDTLKAFLGILDFFRTDNECFHFYGNPISIRKGKVHCINAWYHTKPGVRIAEFPSWSWAGWKGGVKMTSRDHPEYDLRMFRTRKRAEHPAEHPAGHPMSLDEYKEACSTNHPQNMEPVIELTGMMAKMSFEVIKWNSETVGPNEGDNKISMQDGAWAMLPFTANDTYHSFLYLDNEALTGICQFKLPVMVLESGKEKPDQNIVILVLREIGVYRFERVGMIILWRKDNEDKAKLTMCRDKSGKWKRVEPESIPKLQKFTWWKKVSDQRIKLQ